MGVRIDFAMLTVMPNNRSLCRVYSPRSVMSSTMATVTSQRRCMSPDCSGFLMHCFSPIGAGTFVGPEPAEGKPEHTGKT